MRKLTSLIIQDFKLLLRNAIFWVVSVTLVLIVVSINYLIPEDFDATKKGMVHYNVADFANRTDIKSVESEQAVIDSVEKDGTVGFVQNGSTIKIIHPGLSEKAQNALVVLLFGERSDVPVNITRIHENAGEIPGNKRLTPVFICFEALALGFIMAGILMLSEKEQRTIKAYRVSPSGTIHYVLGKSLLFGVIGTIYALLIAIFTIGFEFDWIGFIPLAFVSSVLFTLMGLAVTVFFRDLSSWFFIAALILTLNMLTMASYSVPSFSPWWITWIPSYPILFGFEEVLFGTGKGIGQVFAAIFLEGLVLFGATCILINRKLLRSGGSMA